MKKILTLAGLGIALLAGATRANAAMMQTSLDAGLTYDQYVWLSDYCDVPTTALFIGDLEPCDIGNGFGWP